MKHTQRIARGLPRIVALCLFGVFGACESGPSGPGTLNATVESPTRIAGAVVVEVRGARIQGFSATGPVQVYWAPGPDVGSYRVVLLNAGEAAPLTFAIQVDDLGAPPPIGTTTEATALTNLPIQDLSDFALRIVR